jgi:hypothetical protein
MNQCKADNNKIAAYNNLVESCSSHSDAGHPIQPKSRPIQSAVSRARDEAKQRAENSDAENAKAKTQLPELKRNYEEEKAKERAAEKAAAEARERQRQLDEARARRDAALAAKWHCYGEYGNVQEGFRQCQEVCGRFYNAGFCHDTCYASSDSSIADGRSCFREP